MNITTPELYNLYKRVHRTSGSYSAATQGVHAWVNETMATAEDFFADREDGGVGEDGLAWLLFSMSAMGQVNENAIYMGNLEDPATGMQPEEAVRIFGIIGDLKVGNPPTTTVVDATQRELILAQMFVLQAQLAQVEGAVVDPSPSGHALVPSASRAVGCVDVVED